MLPSDGSSVFNSPMAASDIQVLHFGRNEKPLEPPTALLSWLIRNLKAPRDGRLSKDPIVAQKRSELIAGEPARIEDALRALKSGGREDWFIFEGSTWPDVFIGTADLLVVIEGKRTEGGPTKNTKWMEGRHQMLRHIDCAWEIRGRRSVCGFFIVEGDKISGETPLLWTKAARETTSTDALARSLPHRGSEERAAIAACFAGVTTWQKICAEFGIDFEAIRNLTC